MKTNPPGVHMSVSMGALCPSKVRKTNAPGVHKNVNAASKSACATSEIETIACFRRCARHTVANNWSVKTWRELQLAASTLVSMHGRKSGCILPQPGSHFTHHARIVMSVKDASGPRKG